MNSRRDRKERNVEARKSACYARNDCCRRKVEETYLHFVIRLSMLVICRHYSH